MSYKAKCEVCRCLIFMEDDFDEGDIRVCEECRDSKETEERFINEMDNEVLRIK